MHHSNFFRLSPSFFLILWVIFFFFSDLASCEQDYKYSNCSRLFSCGNLTNIGYPFWGHGRADFCGARGYQLQCRSGVPEIEIMSSRYQILKIDQVNQTMRISRTDLIMDDSCPPTYSDYNNSEILNFTLFTYKPTVTNLTLFYGCAPRPGVAALYQFTCNSTSNNVSNNGAFAYSFPELPRILPNCRWRIGVHVDREGFGLLMSRQSSVKEVVRQGFEVGYVGNASFCGACEGSGGRCGYDSDLNRLTCFCQDGSRQGRCSTTSSPPGGDGGNMGKKTAIAASVAGTLLLLIAIAIFCYLGRERTKSTILGWLLGRNSAKDAQKMKELLRDHKSLAPKIYKYSDLKKITNSFHDKLGKGGYGTVYKGQLHDGRMVAVKVLSETKGNGDEFVNEVVSISRTSHINVVPLLGFCIDRRKRALVYEFMPNGSLEKFIFIKNGSEAHSQLGWEALYKIAIGIARGLEYLHRGCHTRIVHFDIKPHNILLDQDFCPKISDFGLAKLCFKKDSIVSIKGTRGTIGYIAPELVSRNFGGVSHKSDVYSYGMMVLEMVGGRKNVDINVDNTSEIYFPHWIYKQLDQCEDLGLYREVTEEEKDIVRKMTIVGLWCIQIDPTSRPSITEVLDMLEGSVEDLQIPPRPYLSSPSRTPPMVVPSANSTS